MYSRPFRAVPQLGTHLLILAPAVFQSLLVASVMSKTPPNNRPSPNSLLNLNGWLVPAGKFIDLFLGPACSYPVLTSTPDYHMAVDALRNNSQLCNVKKCILGLLLYDVKLAIQCCLSRNIFK